MYLLRVPHISELSLEVTLQDYVSRIKPTNQSYYYTLIMTKNNIGHVKGYHHCDRSSYAACLCSISVVTFRCNFLMSKTKVLEQQPVNEKTLKQYPYIMEWIFRYST